MLIPMGGSAEPWFAPVWRFARGVMLIDLSMGLVVVALSVWKGWSSVEESSTAILIGGLVLGAIGVLPVAGPMVSGAFGAGLNTDPLRNQLPQASLVDPSIMRIFAMFIAAGVLALVYAVVIKTLFA